MREQALLPLWIGALCVACSILPCVTGKAGLASRSVKRATAVEQLQHEPRHFAPANLSDIRQKPHLFAELCECEVNSQACCKQLAPVLNLNCECPNAEKRADGQWVCPYLQYLCNDGFLWSTGSSVGRWCKGGLFEDLPYGECVQSQTCSGVICPKPSTYCRNIKGAGGSVSDYECSCNTTIFYVEPAGGRDKKKDPCESTCDRNGPCVEPRQCNQGLCLCPDGSEENCLHTGQGSTKENSKANGTIIAICVVVGILVLAGCGFVVWRNLTETGSSRKTLAWGREGRATYANASAGSVSTNQKKDSDSDKGIEMSSNTGVKNSPLVSGAPMCVIPGMGGPPPKRFGRGGGGGDGGGGGGGPSSFGAPPSPSGKRANLGAAPSPRGRGTSGFGAAPSPSRGRRH